MQSFNKLLLIILLILLLFSVSLQAASIDLFEAGEILMDFMGEKDGLILPMLEEGLVEIVGYSNFITNEGYDTYYVQSGDSLYKIAQKFATTVSKIKLINGLETDFLYVGQKLYIPQEQMTDIIYQVKSGDSLYKLSLKYGLSIAELKETNNLSSNYLYIGQKLIIPIAAPRTEVSYQVSYGDTLSGIALKFGVDLNLIRKNNNLWSDYIYPGQVLLIPVSGGNLQDNRLELTDEELDLMARAVYSEARGEPFEGQVAIAAVIINRMLHPLFPDSVQGVIFQPWQFTAVQDGQFWLQPNEQAYSAVEAALEGWDPTNGAIYYYNPETATSDWVFYRTVIVKIGNHYFAV